MAEGKEGFRIDKLRELSAEEIQQAAFLTERILILLATSLTGPGVAAVVIGAVAGQIVQAFAETSGMPVEDVAEAMLKQVVLGIENGDKIKKSLP